MDIQQAIKPCPFCGGAGTLWSIDQCETVYAVCMCCGIRTEDFANAKQALSVWNNRHQTAELEHYEDLKREVSRLARESVEREKKLAKLEVEVAHWAQAEQEGRLVMLPFPLGAEFWGVKKVFGSDTLCRIAPFDTLQWDITWVEQEVGRSLFCTRKEAEASLAEKKRATEECFGGATVGERIRDARKLRNLTQKELGELLGVTQATVQQYERGKRNPKIETLQRIANALGVDVGVLIAVGREDDRK